MTSVLARGTQPTPPSNSTSTLGGLHVTVSSLQSIPKNLLPLLPKPDSGKKLTSQEQLLFTIQCLHQHAIKLYRSVYLHQLHIKEKDEQIVRYRGENDHLRSKMKLSSERLGREKSLYMEQLGLTWIQMAKRLNRMDLLEYMEEEWSRINEFVKREMSNVSNGAPSIKISATPEQEEYEDVASSLGQSNTRAVNGGTRRFGEPVGPDSGGLSAENPPRNPPSHHSTSSISSTSSTTGFGKERMSTNAEDSDSMHQSLLRSRAEASHLEALQEEGKVFQSDTQLVQFLKKYAAEGFLEVDLGDLESSPEFQYYRQKAEIDNMTMTDEMLTQWLWMFENDPDLKERIRRQNRFAGIEADAELTIWNNKFNPPPPPPPPIDREKYEKDLQKLEKSQHELEKMKKEMDRSRKEYEKSQKELERLRKEMERYRKRYGQLGDSDDDEDRIRNGRHGRGGRDGNDPFGRNGQRGRGGKNDRNDSSRNGTSRDPNDPNGPNGSRGGFRCGVDYDAIFSPDDPANPNHPDHVQYMKSLMEKAAELERLRQLFEKQKHFLRKKLQEIKTLQGAPKFVTDIDERLLMERIYDYRRRLQEKEAEVQRLKEALREKEMRKLRRDGKLNVFEFLSVDDFANLKLADITDSSLKNEINSSTIDTRPSTALGHSLRSPVNQSSLIMRPEPTRMESSIDISAIQEHEDRKENISAWMNGNDSTFITSVRRPQTAAAAGKIHPSTVPAIKNASEIYMQSEFMSNNHDPSLAKTHRSHSTTLTNTRSEVQNQENYPSSLLNTQRSTSPSRQNMNFGDTAIYEIQRPKTGHGRPIKENTRRNPHVQQSLQIIQTSRGRSHTSLGLRTSRMPK